MKSKSLSLSVALAALFWGAAQADADLLAVEDGPNVVLRFNNAGTQFTFANTNQDAAIGIGLDNSNNVYVVNQGATPASTFHDSVAKFSPTGTPLGFYVTAATPPGNILNAPIDIAFDRTGNGYVTSGTLPNPPFGFVAQFTGAGAFTQAFGTANTNVPSGIGFNPFNGLLYVANSAFGGQPGPNINSFLIYNPANIAAAPTIVTPTGAGALDGAQQIAFDPVTGNVFVMSNGTLNGVSVIQEYTAAGALIRTIAAPAGSKNGEGVAYDPTTGILYASFFNNASNGVIEKYTFTGGTGSGGSVVDSGALATGLLNIAYLAIQPVPEPGSVVLTGLGLVGLGGYHFRRRRQVA